MTVLMRPRAVRKPIPRGPAGQKGDKIAHQWIGTSLALENPDGSYETPVNLQGPEGPAGAAQNFRSIAVAQASVISAGVEAIFVLGYYAAGDGGGALYKFVASEPSHGGKLQTADGKWWEVAEPILYARMIGSKFDVVTVTGDTSIASGTANLTVVGGAFTSADAGKLIIVPGAGAAGADLVSSILSRTSPTQVVLAGNAGTTLLAASKTVSYGTNDTTALQNAINAAVSIKAPLVLSKGTAAITNLALNAQIVIEGYGQSRAPATLVEGTNLAVFSLSAVGLIANANSHYSKLSGFTVTYLGTPASRSGYGIQIASEQHITLSDISSTGHAVGIFDEGSTFGDRVICGGNASYGWIIDGTNAAAFLGEIQLLDCQANGNGASGFRFVGNIIGFFGKRLTAAANGGWGIETSGAISDWALEQPEMSFNALGGVSLGSTGGNYGITGSGLMESANPAPNVLTVNTITSVVLQGFNATGGGRSIHLNSTRNTIANLTLEGQTTAGITLAADTEITVINGIASSGGTVGLEIVAGAGVFGMAGSYFAGTSVAPLSGTPASGSRVTACPGIADV